MHERVFAVSEPGQYIECIYWKGRATARLPKPELQRASRNGAVAPGPDAVRRAWFGAQGALDTGHYRAESLAPGNQLPGPAIILEPTTTVVVYPGWLATVTETGDYLLTKGPQGGNGMSAETTSFDPVLLAVLANRFESIVREMTNTLLRSGRSAVLNMARDFSCSLITSQNELLASAEGLPVHVIGTEFLAEAMCELQPDFADGDAFLHNDPYIGNTHPADHAILVPVFVDGEHMFTAVCQVPPGRLRQRPADHVHAGRARRL